VTDRVAETAGVPLLFQKVRNKPWTIYKFGFSHIGPARSLIRCVFSGAACDLQAGNCLKPLLMKPNSGKRETRR